MTEKKWKCTDPVLQTFKCGKYTGQRTYMDSVALWKGRTRIDTYPSLDAAMKAISEKKDEH
jgi:hypothetical protein